VPLVKIEGAELHVEDTGGAGPPIVFSHGLLWSGRMFGAQVEHLRGRYRCIAYDHRGQGRSPESATPYDMDVLAQDAAALIEKLGVGPCHFVGLSMGGFVGMRLAIRRPELLRSLVLVDTAADPEPRRNIPKYRAMAFVTRLFGYRPLVGTVMKIMFARAFLTDPERAAERRQWEQHLMELRVAPTRTALEAVITRRPIEAELGKIGTPTLVVHGAEDTAIVTPRARRMADGIPGARWVTVPRAGHSSTIEEPDAVSRAIGEFLATIG
jgi:pimeloyl-ACP methyl ester carboxylesterase